MIKKSSLALLLSASLAASNTYAFSFSDILSSLMGDEPAKTEQAKADTAKAESTNTSKTLDVIAKGLSTGDVNAALKQALQESAEKATGLLAKPNGFLNDAEVKIALPENVEKIAKTLRQAGLSSLVDEAVEGLNHAAEDAAGKAAPIFVDAIKNMSIDDGKKILAGTNHAATDYLKEKTLTPLTTAFTPVIKDSLSRVGADKAWQKVFEAYNKIPFVSKKVETDLTAYTTEQSLNGVFVKLAEQEALIRKNPEQQASDLIKKVFSKE